MKIKLLGSIKERHYYKISVIDFNKTGTTTIRKTLELWGFKIENERVASMLTEHFRDWRFERIHKLDETIDTFQDVTFSCSNLYKELD